MRSTVTRSAVVAALATAGILPAHAADLIDPPVIEYEDPAPAIGGWYLRGYLGMTNQNFKGLDYEYFDAPGWEQTWPDKGGFGSSPLFGAGVGYQVNHWLRGELTAEYRGKASFSALDRVTEIADPTNVMTNEYSAKKSEWLLLASVYADLGNFHGIVPYVGAGIGASRNTISHFNDANVMAGGGGYAGTGSQWDLAWALHAGLGYELNERATVDFGYSFVHLGDGKTGQAHNYDPAFSRPNSGIKFKDLYSHDVKVGLRYKLN